MVTRFFFQTRKNSIQILAFMALSFLFGCHENDIFNGVIPGNHVSFSVSTGQNIPVDTQNQATASQRMYGKDAMDMQIITLNDKQGENALYMHMSTENNTEVTLMAGQSVTRGTSIKDMTEYGSFGVFGYLYDGEWKENIPPDFIYNAEATLQGETNQWFTTPTYYWPGKGRNIRFLAYAPYNCDGLTLPQITTRQQLLQFHVADDPAEQKDLLIAHTDEIIGEPQNGSQSLNFHHALTAVKFISGNDMKPGTILEIQLENIYSNATYKIGDGECPIIRDVSGNTNFTLTLSKEVNGEEGEEISSEEQVLMMIPQVLPSNARIIVKYKYIDDVYIGPREFTANIGGQEWEMGKSVTYRISLSSLNVEPVVNFSPNVLKFRYDDNSKSIPLYSEIRATQSGYAIVRRPAPWTAHFFDKEYNEIPCPEWLEFPEKGEGGTIYNRQTIDIKVNYSPRVDNQYEDNISRISINQTSGYNPYNLSNGTGNDIIENTANCYIINAPGTYSLPLVYGNAIKNKNDNRQAYAPDVSGSNVLTPFINHLNSRITSPYIYLNNNCNPHDAVLVYQEIDGLITDVRLSDDKKHLLFEVSTENITQCNAVVAVRDESQNIMWSWHIWITGYKLGDYQTVTNNEGSEYKFMPVNVGEIRKGVKIYDEGSVIVRITQDETGAFSECLILKFPYSERDPSSQPLFQFGRKDPIFDYMELGLSNPSTYIKNTILNPNVRLNNEDGLVYDNLWNSNYSDDGNIPVVKTIYDPSPVGYCLPDIKVFTGTTYNGETQTWYNHCINNLGYINSPFTLEREPDSNHGAVFYCRKMESAGSYNVEGGTMYFPYTGMYQYNLKVIQGSSDKGFYWCANRITNGLSSDVFNINNSSVAPSYTLNISKGDACAVRPVKEE